ncbi:ankyrin repeat protein, putative [uncultured Candidatus Thioglobus sp.]|nr:ankyrin repeat protein, putative [uncultured Candidatus Thioglobus sp.]
MTKLFTTLLPSCSNLNKTDRDGRTAIMYACLLNRPKMVTALVERGADIHLRDTKGRTALAYSCDIDISILSHLLELGADVDSMDNSDITILMTACEKGNFEAVKVLLDHDANINITDNCGHTALNIARKFERYKIRYLLKINQNSVDRSGHTKLMSAVFVNDFKLFTVLLSDWDDIDKKDPNGRTALMHACLSNRPKMVAALLKKGADPNLRDNDGRTALMFSCECIDILCQLIRMKVEVNYKSRSGETALMAAWSFANYTAVYILLTYGANIVNDGDASLETTNFSEDDIKQLLEIKQSIESKVDLSLDETRQLEKTFLQSLNTIN